MCLYDVTTLYFEAEKEDDLRRVGYSKERRVDPQIVVGLLVDCGGNPHTHPGSWRAVWAYSHKRAVRDRRTLAAQEQRARAVVNGQKTARTPRSVKTNNGAQTLDQASLDRARRLVGLKGYVTNIAGTAMPADEVISAYHDLWQVEASFRMSKSDLAARPMFHRTQDAIEAHLTIVFAALAVSREVQTRTGLSIRNRAGVPGPV